ncbi:MAG: hypothetical protein Q9210_003395 [Variospora velana]
MPSHTPTQKAAIQQFIGITNAKESAAAKQLKNNNWNLQNAVNAPATLHQRPRTPSKASTSCSTNTEVCFTPAATEEIRIRKLIDLSENAKEEPDSIGVQGCMHYLGDLGLSLEEPVVLAVLTELDAPTMGELTRKGFVEGWKKLR